MHEWWDTDHLTLIIAALRKLRRGRRVYIVISSAGVRLLSLAAVLLILAGCGAAATPDPAAIAQAVQATVAALPAPAQAPTLPPVEITRVVEVEVTRIVEATRIVEVTAVPEPTQPPSQEPPSLVKFPDIIASQDENGMILSVDGVSIVPFADMPADFQAAVSAFDYWDNISTVIALSVVLTNTTDATLNIYPDQGVIVAGSQQADADIWSSDDVGGEIFAGVTKSGLVLFGLPQPVDLANLASIRYIVNAATDLNYSSIGQDYDLTISLTP